MNADIILSFLRDGFVFVLVVSWLFLLGYVFYLGRKRESKRIQTVCLLSPFFIGLGLFSGSSVTGVPFLLAATTAVVFMLLLCVPEPSLFQMACRYTLTPYTLGIFGTMQYIVNGKSILFGIFAGAMFVLSSAVLTEEIAKGNIALGPITVEFSE